MGLIMNTWSRLMELVMYIYFWSTVMDGVNNEYMVKVDGVSYVYIFLVNCDGVYYEYILLI